MGCRHATHPRALASLQSLDTRPAPVSVSPSLTAGDNRSPAAAPLQLTVMHGGDAARRRLEEIADAVSVGISKRARVDLIDNGVFPPWLHG